MHTAADEALFPTDRPAQVGRFRSPVQLGFVGGWGHHRWVGSQSHVAEAPDWRARLRLPADTTRIDLPAQGPAAAAWPTWIPDDVRVAFSRIGVGQPYAHQVRAAEAAWTGSDVAIATGTASGKSLAYLLPILSSQAGQPYLPPTALYLAPTKALARDQARRLAELDLPGLRVAAYDGDTPPEERSWARRHATVVVSNPDMLHRALLPRHDAWQSFVKRLRFIVLDEFHIYRGLFGAHLAAVLRRLLRVAEHHGGTPVVIGASATVHDPATTLETLTGRPALAVVGDQAARARTELLLVPATEDGLIRQTIEVFADLVAAGVPTLAFVKSRRAAEAVSAGARRRLAQTDPALASRVASYRAGYLPEERRELEQRLRSGDLVGVAATSALELGIDVSGLDAVVVAGWPGTRSALRQRIGRAGRADRPALALFLAAEDPLDAYLVRNPAEVLGAAEAIVIDAANPYVLAPHLCAAAAEVPLTTAEAAEVFGASAADLLPILAERGLLRMRPSGWFWTRSDRPSDLADLRGIAGDPVAVIEEGTGAMVAAVDRASADRTVHEGAVYTHLGTDYLVLEFDQEHGVATVRVADVPYFTYAQSVADNRIADRLAKRQWGAVSMHFGVVDVSSQVTSFLKRRVPTGEVLGSVPLDLPSRTLRTKSVWWEIPDEVLRQAGLASGEIAGAAHAAEHAAIGLLPLFAQCDRWDIGGLSTAAHPDTGVCTIFVHDGFPGGAGFAERGFSAAVPWLSATLDTIRSCPCATGCPRCVQSPKCGNGNEPLSKSGAIALLEVILGHSPEESPTT